jgi:hypothetical protein
MGWCRQNDAREFTNCWIPYKLYFRHQGIPDSTVYLVLLNWSNLETLSPNGGSALISRFALGWATMETQTEQELRGEIDRLLRQQLRFLESRCFGTATEAELLEYEFRQDLVRELCEKLILSQHRVTFIQPGI